MRIGRSIGALTVICATLPGQSSSGAVRTNTGGGTCDQAAEKAAKDHNVPLEILLAMARVESGRTTDGRLEPWPWAINQAGQGYWFDNADQAISFASDLLAQGQENFDVGCFQINLHWHGAKFSSLNDALDPQTNADYAAQFLSDLFQSEGGWGPAVAAYHSRNPPEAEAYLAKVDAALTNLRQEQPASVAQDRFALAEAPVVPRANSFPLLQGHASGVGASLVPITDGGIPLFAALP